MNTKPRQPASLLVIKDLEALKCIADPLRTQIMEVLNDQTLTVNQIGERLGLAASKLYYHINLLEKHGFVQVVETSVKGNIIEKSYGAAALNFELDKELLHFAAERGLTSINEMLVSTLDATRADLIRSLEAREFNRQQGAQDHPRRAFLNRVLRRIPDGRAEEFMERLTGLLTEFEAEPEARASEAPMYAMTVALYPSFYYHEELDKPKKAGGRRKKQKR
ncbi:MAG: winged helix-turn-helix transcriptional regulator [Chloroflexi bacterium]|nr:winged helix-turn-helix transcriptional regulator [Chloroflexota bacterium]